MTFTRILLGTAALLIAPVVVQAQTVAPEAPAATEQVAPALPAADPASAAPAAEPAPPAVASAADGVTKEGSKYMKDGRKATKIEVAEYKKAAKSKPE